ncbi:MAG: DUF4962 domain-containing protein [Bryobacteraceae bacterium]
MNSRREFLAALGAAAAMPRYEARPRLLTTPADAPLWRKTAAAIPATLWRPRSKEPYEAPRPLPGGNSGSAGYVLLELAAAWLAAGDDFYFQQARDAMLRVCEYVYWGGINGKPKDTDLDAGALLMGVGAAYDLFHAKLAAADRKRIGERLARQAAKMYAHHSVRPGVQWEQNHIYIDLGGLFCAAVALAGEAPESGRWYELGHRTIRNALHTLDTPDGAYYEGIGYWNFGFALHFMPVLHLFRNAAGENPFATFGTLRNLKYYLMHVILPGGRDWLSLGDVGPRATARASLGRARYVMLKTAREYRDPECQFLARWFGEVNQLGPASDPWTLIFWDPTVAERDPRAAWAPGHHFRDLGLVTVRTNWRDDAAHFALRCGPALGRRATGILLRREVEKWKPSTGHVHPDLNALLIYDHGEHLATDTGYTWEKRTRDHGTVAVDGGGQIGDGLRWPNYDPWDRFGRIGAFLSLAGEYSYTRGEAANGYQEKLRLTRFDRHVSMMADPEATYLFVHDVLESRDPHRYDWLLALPQPAEPAGENAWRVRAGARAMTIRLLSRALFSQEILKVVERTKDGAVPERGYRVALTVEGRRDAGFSVVLLLHAAAALPPSVELREGAVRVASALWEDLLAAGGNGAGLAGDGHHAALRRRGGQRVRWAVHDATRFSFEGRELLAASKPVSLAVAARAAAIHAPQPAEIAVACAARPARCLLDGRPAAFTYDGRLRLSVPAGSHQLVFA